MPKKLSDGHKKVTFLTTAPVNPLAPTAGELNAGIDVSSQILDDDFTFGPADSDTVQERALSDDTNIVTYAASNWQAAMTFWRYYDATTGLAVTTEETGYQAAKTKGTDIHVYMRENGNKSGTAWVASEEAIYIEVITDNPQLPSQNGGYIKRRVPMGPQRGAFVTVSAT